MSKVSKTRQRAVDLSEQWTNTTIGKVLDREIKSLDSVVTEGKESSVNQAVQQLQEMCDRAEAHQE